MEGNTSLALGDVGANVFASDEVWSDSACKRSVRVLLRICRDESVLLRSKSNLGVGTEQSVHIEVCHLASQVVVDSLKLLKVGEVASVEKVL